MASSCNLKHASPLMNGKVQSVHTVGSVKFKFNNPTTSKRNKSRGTVPVRWYRIVSAVLQQSPSSGKVVTIPVLGWWESLYYRKLSLNPPSGNRNHSLNCK